MKYRKCEGETGSNYIPFCFLGQYRQIRISKSAKNIIFIKFYTSIVSINNVGRKVVREG